MPDISKSLEQNINLLKESFKDCGDIVSRRFPVGANKEVWVYLIYIDSLIDRGLVEGNIISSLMIQARKVPPDFANQQGDVYSFLKDGAMSTADLTDVTSYDEVTLAILSGNTALLVDGYDKAVIISTKGAPNRGVQSAENEVVVQGSKEAFSEVMRFNTSLIRRRIRDINLKVKQLKVGRRSETDVALMYLTDVVRSDVLEEALKRINSIDVDAILDSGHLEQYIEDDWLSPFPQIQTTERPDKAASAILEGRIVIIVDNSPFVLIIPAVFNTFFQSSEDYYQRWEIMSFTRLIRFGAAIMSVSIPALYIAIAVYHPSMLPTQLIFKMAGSRQMVPFPAVVEILIMELAFELIREAGVRLPGAVGSTIGIVGGLIIGQAAVEAGLVSPIIVVIVAMTGLCSFAVPHISLVTGFRLMKYFLIICASVLGLFGFWIGTLILIIHLVSLKSFGFPFMFPFTSGEINEFNDLKDSLFRLPVFTLRNRPIFANPRQQKRLSISKAGNRHKKE